MARAGMARTVLHSGALGHNGDPRWFVLQKETLVHYASFLEASLGTKPDGAILLAKVLSIKLSEDEIDQKLVLRVQGVKRIETITLTAIEHDDDLEKWQQEIQKASEAVNRARDAKRLSEISTAKTSVKSGKLSVLYGSEIADQPSGQVEARSGRNSQVAISSDIIAKTAEKDDEIQELKHRLEDAQADAMRTHRANLEVLQAVHDQKNASTVASKFELAMVKVKMDKHQDELRIQLDEERRRCYEHLQELNELRRKHAKCEPKLKQVLEQLERQKLVVQSEQDASHRLRLQLKVLRAAAAGIKAKNGVEPIGVSQDLAPVQAEAAHMKDLNEGLQLKMDSLKAAHIELKKDAESIRQESVELHSENSRLETRMKEQFEEITVLRKKAHELERTKENNCELEQRRAQLEAKVQEMTDQINRFQELMEEAGVSVNGAQESILRSENTALHMKKEELRTQVNQLTAKNRDMARMLDRQRQTADDLRRQLQLARAEQEACWSAVHEAEDRYKSMHQQVQEAETALTAALARGGGEGGGPSPTTEAEVVGETLALDWDLPEQFRSQLGPALRLPPTDVRNLEEKPIYHGTLGMSRNDEFQVRYCVLYADGLECFNEPVDVPKGHRPALVLDMHQVSVIEFDKTALGLLLQFQDDADMAVCVPSTKALREWCKAFLSVLNRHEDKEAVSPAKSPRDFVKRKTYFTARAGKKGTWQQISTHKNGREAGLLIHGKDVGNFAVADKPGGAHVNPFVADKLTMVELGKSASPVASARNAGEVSDKITGDRVPPPHEDPASCQWLKITQGSEGQRQQRRSRGEVAGKVNEEGKVPLSAKSRARRPANKITGNERAIMRASSPGVPNKVGEIVL